MNAAGREASTARVEAQAKLNLFLRVLGREPSGYHRLETLFQRIALADAVTVTVASTGRSLDVRGADTGPVEQNLAWRAAVAFAEAAGWPAGFRIEIEKRIPVGGGLGGGSADAAAVLRALRALAPAPPAEAALADIAFRLGADVPYLLSTHPLALGTGHGEHLFPLPPLPPRDVVLAVPPFAVSSADAFRWFDEGKALRHSGTRATLPAVGRLEWKAIVALAANDLEGVVNERHPQVSALRTALSEAGAALAMMSGSGSTVFGLFNPGAAPSPILAIDGAGARTIRSFTLETVAEVALE